MFFYRDYGKEYHLVNWYSLIIILMILSNDPHPLPVWKRI